MSFLVNSYSFSDVDALDYISRVEQADGQDLEFNVQVAIDNFVKGCKSDGIWDAIKASCILAGARTLSGALVPLKGTAPTNFNFVAGDYNRKTGLVGNASTKYLDSNRGGNADSVSNHSACIYISSSGTPSTSTQVYLGNFGAAGFIAGSTSISIDSNQLFFRSRNKNFDSAAVSTATGLVGLARISPSAYSARANQQNTSFTRGTENPVNSTDILIFRDGSSSFPWYTNARIAFYSIGESLDLALLDAHVTTLINAYGAL